MTNLEKIARLESMIKNSQKNVELYASTQSNPDSVTNLVANEYRNDIKAMKFALKAIQLMQDQVNDEGGNDGE